MTTIIKAIASERITLSAIGYLYLGIPPEDDSLIMSRDTINDGLKTRLGNEELGVANLLARKYSGLNVDSENDVAESFWFKVQEHRFLGNRHVKTFVSALADVLFACGDDKLLRLLLSFGRYVAVDSVKTYAMRSIPVFFNNKI